MLFLISVDPSLSYSRVSWMRIIISFHSKILPQFIRNYRHLISWPGEENETLDTFSPFQKSIIATWVPPDYHKVTSRVRPQQPTTFYSSSCWPNFKFMCQFIISRDDAQIFTALITARCGSFTSLAPALPLYTSWIGHVSSLLLL